MSVALRYAEALFLAVAGEEGPAVRGDAGDAAGVAGELDAAVDLLAREPDLRSFLEHPGLSLEAKRQVLREAFAPRVRRLSLNFLQLLLDKHRMKELPDIARAFRARVEEALGQDEARVQSARPLTEAQIEAIAAVLERRTGKKVRLTPDVRPDLIGGVRVVMGDRVLDGTLSGQLERLALELAGRN